VPSWGGDRIISRVRGLLTWINANCLVKAEFATNNSEHSNGKPRRQAQPSPHFLK
jgi:hypothetical protein